MRSRKYCMLVSLLFLFFGSKLLWKVVVMVGWSFTRSRSPGFTPLLIQTTRVCQKKKPKTRTRLQELRWQEGGAVSRRCHSLSSSSGPLTKQQWQYENTHSVIILGSPVSAVKLCLVQSGEKGHEKEPGMMFFYLYCFFFNNHNNDGWLSFGKQQFNSFPPFFMTEIIIVIVCIKFQIQ